GPLGPEGGLGQPGLVDVGQGEVGTPAGQLEAQAPPDARRRPRDRRHPVPEVLHDPSVTTSSTSDTRPSSRACARRAMGEQLTHEPCAWAGREPCQDRGVSIPVELDDLPERIAGRTGQAYLVTIRDQRPHVVSVTPRPEAGTIVVGAG